MEELLANLITLGLTRYEAKCYIALIGANELAAVDVARVSGVPRTRTYEVLENLLKKGLCISTPGTVIKYKASDPSMLKIKGGNRLEKILSKIEEYKREVEKYENEKIEVEKARDEAISTLSAIFQKGQANKETFIYKYFEIIRNPTLLNEKLNALIANAKHEILGLTMPKPIDRVRYGESELTAIKKGVICKNIYEIPEDIEKLEFFVKEIEHSLNIGETLKVAEKLPMDLMVFDNEMVMLSVKDPLPHIDSYTCMFAKHKILAGFFTLTYKTLWDNAMDPDVLPGILEQRKK